VLDGGPKLSVAANNDGFRRFSEKELNAHRLQATWRDFLILLGLILIIAGAVRWTAGPLGFGHLPGTLSWTARKCAFAAAHDLARHQHRLEPCAWLLNRRPAALHTNAPVA
jgi:hypothetical protein